jgi:YHS domain-containing protein
MVMDPVCNMDVDEKTATAKSEYKGKTYYFCAPGCKAEFDKNPDKYVKETPKSG